MSGSKFVTGILSSGVEVEIAKAIMDAQENFKNQMELTGEFLRAYSDMSLATAENVLQAGYEMAKAEKATANGQIGAGAANIANPITSIGMRFSREGLFGKAPLIGASKEFFEMNEESNQISTLKESLHNGQSEAFAGKDKALTVPSGKSPEEEIEANKKIEDVLNRKTINEHFANENQQDQDLIKQFRSFRYPKNDEEKNNNPVRLEAYKNMEKKLDRAEENNQSRRRQYNEKTERLAGYFQSTSMAAANFTQAFVGGYNTAKARRKEADYNYEKTVSESQAQFNKTLFDTTQQTSQSSYGTISDLTRAISEIAQANRM